MEERDKERWKFKATKGSLKASLETRVLLNSRRQCLKGKARVVIVMLRQNLRVSK